MGCISGFAKTIVYIFNVLCALVGVVLIVVGSIFYVAIDEYYELTKKNLIVAPTLVIAVGVIVFIIAFLGCCGVIQKSQCMLFTYATILSILFVIQMVAGTYGYVQVKNDKGELKQDINKGMNQVFFDEYQNIEIQHLFRILERKLKCCGVNSPLDYIAKGQLFSASCCGIEDKEGLCIVPTYVKGCSGKLYAFLVKNVQVIANVAFGIAAIELIGAIFAIYLARRIDHY